MSLALIAIVLFAAFTKAAMDLSSTGSLPWPAYFWDKSISWTRKWKKDALGFVIVPPKEAFPGSSTVFVWLTDGWHLAQFFFLNSLFACFLFFLSWPKVLLMRILFGIAFEGFYRLLKRKG